MITKEQLEKYAKIKNYNLGQAEKDYYQEIILFILYKKYNQNLVFKGGTALTKCYGLDRFSEDLDFTAKKEDLFNETIKKGLDDFYIDYLNEEKRHKNSIDLTYWIKGPLYNGQKNSMCKILLDINLKETITKKPEIKKIGLNIEEIPLFEVIVMNENEILTEKIRAIMTRNKARDLYDTYYLILKKAKTSIKEIQEKLDKIEKTFNKKEFYDKVNEKEKIWDTELKRIVKTYPKFNETKKTINYFIQNLK